MTTMTEYIKFLKSDKFREFIIRWHDEGRFSKVMIVDRISPFGSFEGKEKKNA